MEWILNIAMIHSDPGSIYFVKLVSLRDFLYRIPTPPPLLNSWRGICLKLYILLVICGMIYSEYSLSQVSVRAIISWLNSWLKSFNKSMLECIDRILIKEHVIYCY